MTDYQATIYPGNTANPTVANADANRKPVAVCFSGGGSRALTCAWGQLLGLSTLKDVSGKPLLDEVRYISSVSGGSWAAVLYTFRSEKFTDAEFLGNNYPPSQLYYGQDSANGLNVCNMGDFALGKIPQNFANLLPTIDPLKNIIADFITLTVLKSIPLKTSAKWLWMYITGENVLADFGLYSYKNSLLKPHETPWNYPDAKFFSLSPSYAENAIFSKAEAPPKDAFVYARTDVNGQPACPMLIINTNIIGNECPDVCMSAPLQIPTQVSAVSAGIYGGNPCAADSVGGGSVESFAFSSSLTALSGAEQVSAAFPRRYTLADITSSSSAFYAAILADPLEAVISALSAHNDDQLHAHFSNFLGHAERFILADVRRHLSALNDEIQQLGKESLIENLVPQYNYWPVSQVNQGSAANRNTEFTDGGDLENTGIAGLLAQVQDAASHIIAFVNGSEVLEEKGGQIIAAIQMAPLFGLAYDENLGQFEKYLPDGVNPFTGLTDPTGFLQVFDNSHAEFDDLRLGLYTTNGSGAKTDAAFCRQTLEVVENALLGITQTYTVNVLWVQNAQVNHWQNQITDESLKQKIEAGQDQGGDCEFADFPYYSTFLKIHQTAAETNTLAQMWAWCVSDQESPLSTAIAEMFL